MVIRHRRIGIPVKLRKASDIVPDLFIIGVENMSAVAVNLNALHLFSVDITANMISLINYKDGLTRFLCLLGKSGTKKTRAYNQIIVSHRISLNQ